MISSLFRSTPKWQSPKSQKRIEALGDLDHSKDKDLWVLLKLAREDNEPAVRREAVKYLHDLDVIAQIQKRDLEASVRESATQRLHDLLAGKTAQPLPLPTRLERLQRITAPQTLVHLIREADAMEIRLAAIAHLNDEMYLDDIARNSTIARLRLAAAERITTPALLEALAESSRQKDKNVYKAIRTRLDEQAQGEKQARDLLEKRDSLCAAMETHARSAMNPLYAAKAESLRQQWQELQPPPEPQHTERFETAFAIAWKQITDIIAAEQRKADEAQAREEMRQSVTTLEATLGEYHGQPDFDPPSLAALRKTQRLRWELATQLQPATADLAERYGKASASLDQLEALLLQWQQDALMVEATLARLEQADDDEKKLSLQALHDVRENYRGYGLPLPEMLHRIPGLPVEAPVKPAKAEKARAENPEKDAARQKLKNLLDQAAASVDAGNSRDADKQLRKAQDLARDQHLQDARLAELREKVRELKSWAGFAVQPKKEALIASMQALITHVMEPDDKADAIHALQEEWKALGVADASVEQPLWEQFKAAGDQAFEPCRQHFAAQRELRQQNLEKRIALCEQLEGYRDGLPENIDWKKHDTILRTARQEWQQYSPSDRQKTQPVQERFNALLKTLEGLLLQVQKQHESRKRDLIARVVALADSSDLRSACDQAKQLQLEWKGVGQAHAKVDHRLWQDFRAACDALFNKREAEFKARQEARDSSVKEAEELIRSLTTLVDGNSKGHEAEIAALEEKFRGLTLPKEKSKALNDAFQAQRLRIEQARRDQQNRQRQEKREARLQEWASKAVDDDSHDSARAHTLLLDLEIVLELPSPDADQRSQRLMQRLQERGLRKSSGDEGETLLTELLRTVVSKTDLPAMTTRLNAVLQKTPK
jgi:hypothetical protein